ncbi:MAG: hypothetical protein RLZZ573_1581 [Pseudomonadota bacterium]
MKRRISMTTRKELTEAQRTRYHSATFADRIKILDEFVALTGSHRKHAIRVLRAEVASARAVPVRNRLYDEAVQQALTILWEAADRVCGKRLKALIPTLVDAMERHGHLDLDPVIRTKVLQVSAATIDRALAPARTHIDAQRKRRKGVGAATPCVRLVVASKKYSFRSTDNNETKIFRRICRTSRSQAAYPWQAHGARSRAGSQRQLPHGQELDAKRIAGQGDCFADQRETSSGLECPRATAGPARNPRLVRRSSAGVVS